MRCFTELGFDVITETAKSSLVQYVLANQGEVQDHLSTKNGKPDGISYVQSTQAMSTILPEIAKLRVKCTIPFECSIVAIKPNVASARHRDGRLEARQCTIITPLYPEPKLYAPLNFWETAMSLRPFEKMTAFDTPALVNIQELHSIQNNDNLRLNFQLAFGVTYAEVRELLLAGKLFKGSIMARKSE